MRREKRIRGKNKQRGTNKIMGMRKYCVWEGERNKEMIDNKEIEEGWSEQRRRLLWEEEEEEEGEKKTGRIK